MTRRFAPPALLLLLAAACEGLGDPGSRRVPGVIDTGGGEDRALLVPDTVVAGAPFTATVTTFGRAMIYLMHPSK